MTNTQSKPSRIPEYFIFRNDGSVAFQKCLGWFNEKFKTEFNLSGFWNWYGYDGYDEDHHGAKASDSVHYFTNNPTRFEPAELWALIQEEQKGDAVTTDRPSADVRSMAHEYLVALIQLDSNLKVAPEIALDLALDLDRRLKEKGL